MLKENSLGNTYIQFLGIVSIGCYLKEKITWLVLDYTLADAHDYISILGGLPVNQSPNKYLTPWIVLLVYHLHM